jgi:two-component system, NtrC family, sensor kinase
VKFLQNTSIKCKQALIVVLTSGVALTFACLAFASYEVLTFRTEMVEKLSTLTEIIGNNSAAALDFSDPKSAKETLSALQAEPHIVAGCIYTAKGDVFAVYERSGNATAFVPPAFERDGQYFDKDSLRLFRPIVRDGESLGTVYVVSDLNALYSRLNRYAFIAVGVFIISGFVAFLISLQLQKLISGPILTLVQTAHAVTIEKNYSVRAVKKSNDELGTLIDAFNEMLHQIQERDSALQSSHVELENRVNERTREVVNSLSLIRATLESTTDGILVTNGNGVVTSFDEKFVKMWGISRGLTEPNDVQTMLDAASPQLVIAEDFLSQVKASDTNPQVESFDLLEFKDGRLFEQYSKPQMVEEHSVGRVWSLQRHGVEVIREFEDVPPMDVEKHKILQILVNLVRNAKYACDESLRVNKVITLRVAKHDDVVSITVSDNGIGIPPENLVRIFNHGFTTRKEGHGFGLHSAVLAAMEMGGSLRVHSDGVDEGATFILELPYKTHP